jgi:putative phosphoribosyl transferase
VKAERAVSFPTAGGLPLHGELHLPRNAPAIVVFVHGSGTTRHDPQNEFVAHRLQRHGLGTLLVDLLEDYETQERHNVFDVGMQAQRLVEVVRWLRAVEPHCEKLPVGYFGTGVGTGAALIAAARAPELVSAVVSRGGRPDTAVDWLPRVRAPTLFIDDEAGVVPDWVDAAFCACTAEKELVRVESPSHSYTEPEAIEAVAQHAERWFARHLMHVTAPPAFPRGAMSETRETLPQLGAPDAELKNSPIVDEAEYDEHAASPDLEIEQGACYFNGEAFRIGQYVRSGSEVLLCNERGVWVRQGEKRPD